MKISEKSSAKKQENKNKPVSKPKQVQVLIVAQEIKFARLLAGNEKKTRDRALKSLKKWLLGCFQKGYEFKEDDFLRIWKGLFYAVWMSDKPLVQEELCENIAGILDLFPSEQLKYALLMSKVGFKMLASEWYGIDQHRMDKCLMLVRRYLRGSLRCIARCEWSETACKAYAKMLTGSDGLFALKTPLYARNATSMLLHFIDCYLEEIAKVSEGKISGQSLSHLLRPFCAYMCNGESATLCMAARRLLTALLRQSDQHMVYTQRTRAWEKMGCPEGGPEALVSDDEENDDEEQNGDESDEENSYEKPLDPRAGRVNVYLPTLPVPCEEIAEMLKNMLKNITSKAHKRAKICMQRFEKLARKEYPLPIEVPTVGTDLTPKPKPKDAAKNLITLEKTLISSSDELTLRGLSRKHRKRLLAKSRAGLSIIEDAAKLTSAQYVTTAGDWTVIEDTSSKDNTKNVSNKENIEKKRKHRNLDKLNGEVATKKRKIEDKTAKRKEKREQSAPILTEVPKSLKMYETSKKNGQKSLKNKLIKKKSDNIVTRSEVIPKNTPGIIPVSKVRVESNENPKKDPVFNPKPKKNEKKTVVAKKVKNFQKQLSPRNDKKSIETPKKVKFVLKNNSMQGTIDYYQSVKKSPSIPFDSSKLPSKTNLKVSTPSPINPFFKKKLKLRM